MSFSSSSSSCVMVGTLAGRASFCGGDAVAGTRMGMVFVGFCSATCTVLGEFGVSFWCVSCSWISAVSSMIAGMGVFARVCLMWRSGCWRTTLGAVGLWDVVGVRTLGACSLLTLGAGWLLMIWVSHWMSFTCSTFSFVGIVTSACKMSTNSFAAINVLSSSDTVGTLQCAGKSLVALAILMPFVAST